MRSLPRKSWNSYAAASGAATQTNVCPCGAVVGAGADGCDDVRAGCVGVGCCSADAVSVRAAVVGDGVAAVRVGGSTTGSLSEAVVGPRSCCTAQTRSPATPTPPAVATQRRLRGARTRAGGSSVIGSRPLRSRPTADRFIGRRKDGGADRQRSGYVREKRARGRRKLGIDEHELRADRAQLPVRLSAALAWLLARREAGRRCRRRLLRRRRAARKLAQPDGVHGAGHADRVRPCRALSYRRAGGEAHVGACRPGMGAGERGSPRCVTPVNAWAATGRARILTA